jgi:hypothetical protein
MGSQFCSGFSQATSINVVPIFVTLNLCGIDGIVPEKIIIPLFIA